MSLELMRALYAHPLWTGPPANSSWECAGKIFDDLDGLGVTVTLSRVTDPVDIGPTWTASARGHEAAGDTKLEALGKLWLATHKGKK